MAANEQGLALFGDLKNVSPQLRPILFQKFKITAKAQLLTPS